MAKHVSFNDLLSSVGQVLTFKHWKLIDAQAVVGIFKFVWSVFHNVYIQMYIQVCKFKCVWSVLPNAFYCIALQCTFTMYIQMCMVSLAQCVFKCVYSNVYIQMCIFKCVWLVLHNVCIQIYIQMCMVSPHQCVYSNAYGQSSQCVH